MTRGGGTQRSQETGSLRSITTTGVNDATTISGTVSGSRTEGHDAPKTGDALSVTDPYAAEALFLTPSGLTVILNAFTYDETTGAWTYTLDNSYADAEAPTVALGSGSDSQIIVATLPGADDDGSAEFATDEDYVFITGNVLVNCDQNSVKCLKTTFFNRK